MVCLVWHVVLRQEPSVVQIAYTFQRWGRLDGVFVKTIEYLPKPQLCTRMAILNQKDIDVLTYPTDLMTQMRGHQSCDVTP